MEAFSVILFIISIGLCAAESSKIPDSRTAVFNESRQLGRTFNDIKDVADFSIYYSLKTNQTIRKMLPRPWYHPGWPLRLPFVGEPCSCEGLKCICCAGIKIQQFNFDRKACTELTYDPAEFMITIDVTMNGQKVMTNTVSAKNPPPFCIPVVVPYLPPGLVDMCIRLFDISVQDQGLHVCMDLETRVDKAPVLVLHFDCMNMGLNGISLSKPGSSSIQSQNAGTSSKPALATSEPEQQNSDIYDSVTETKSDTTHYPFELFIKNI